MKKSVFKKLFAAMLSFTLAFAVIPFNGFITNALTDGDYEYSIQKDGTASIIEYKGYDYDVTIPSTLYGYSVTAIGDCAFYGCTGLTSITIPNSVTKIGSGAFEGCTALESIAVDSENKTYHSKDNCLIETATNKLVLGCKNSIIPNYLTTIGNGAFFDCTGLTSITIPNNVTTIGNSAFYGCTKLTSITIPNSVTTIGNGAFNNCTGLTSITIPNNVTTIGHTAFSYCTGLTSVTIPNNVTTIGDYAFYGCTKLTSITIPNSVTTIGYSAFFGCTGLTSVTIPNSVTTIGGEAFNGCTNLKKVIYCGTRKEYDEIYLEDKIYTPDYRLFGNDKLQFHSYDDASDTTCNICGHVRRVMEDASDPSQWYYEAVNYCVENKYINGYAGTNVFGALDAIKRQDFVCVLANYCGVDLSGYGDRSYFPDVPVGTYYTGAVNWAYENGIVNGYENGYFGAGDLIAREQLVTMLYNFAKNYRKKNVSASKTRTPWMADYSQVSNWAKPAIEWAVKNGVITGKTGRYIAPLDAAARCEIAVIIKNIDDKGIF